MDSKMMMMLMVILCVVNLGFGQTLQAADTQRQKDYLKKTGLKNAETTEVYEKYIVTLSRKVAPSRTAHCSWYWKFECPPTLSGHVGYTVVQVPGIFTQCYIYKKCRTVNNCCNFNHHCRQDYVYRNFLVSKGNAFKWVFARINATCCCLPKKNFIAPG